MTPAQLRPGDYLPGFGGVVESVASSLRRTGVSEIEIEGQPGVFFLDLAEDIPVTRPQADDGHQDDGHEASGLSRASLGSDGNGDGDTEVW